MKPLKQRWLEKIQFPADEDDPNACWLWLGANSAGYGQIRSDGKMLQAHRVGYELVFGPIPDGLMALHCCNVKRCVRPSHIYAGTNSDNMLDRSATGEFDCTGERNSNAALTWQDARAIRTARSRGAKQCDLAFYYGVSPATISRVIRNELWREDEATTPVPSGASR